VQDKQYLIGVVQCQMRPRWTAPSGSCDRSRRSALQNPGVEHAIGFPGLSVNGVSTCDNAAVMFLPLDRLRPTKTKNLSAPALVGL